MKKASIALLILSGAIASCRSKEEKLPENTQPIIIVNTPLISDTVCEHFETNVIKHSIQDSLSINFTLKGAVNLSQYKISAHENEDCHDHGERPERLDETHWEINKTVNIDTRETNITETFGFSPEIKTGNYHLTIQLIDVKGQEAPVQEINVVLLP